MTLDQDAVADIVKAHVEVTTSLLDLVEGLMGRVEQVERHVDDRPLAGMEAHRELRAVGDQLDRVRALLGLPTD